MRVCRNWFKFSEGLLKFKHENEGLYPEFEDTR